MAGWIRGMSAAKKQQTMHRLFGLDQLYFTDRFATIMGFLTIGVGVIVIVADLWSSSLGIRDRFSQLSIYGQSSSFLQMSSIIGWSIAIIGLFSHIAMLFTMGQHYQQRMAKQKAIVDEKNFNTVLFVFAEITHGIPLINMFISVGTTTWAFYTWIGARPGDTVETIFYGIIIGLIFFVSGTNFVIKGFHYLHHARVESGRTPLRVVPQERVQSVQEVRQPQQLPAAQHQPQQNQKTQRQSAPERASTAIQQRPAQPEEGEGEMEVAQWTTKQMNTTSATQGMPDWVSLHK